MKATLIVCEIVVLWSLGFASAKAWDYFTAPKCYPLAKMQQEAVELLRKEKRMIETVREISASIDRHIELNEEK